ncbi:MAG: Uncharacterised protein [Flavobacteriales bacterium]|nr:MAG: Uncharacterised protein [Flavobacteriales bacterium]
MPFLKEFIINGSSKISLWKVNLGELKTLKLNNKDSKLLKMKKHRLLKEQFLATRKIIELENPKNKINYNDNRKPSLNSSVNISISHSNDLAAIAFSENKCMGIDVQLIKKKILKIQNKFLSKSEKISLGKNPSADILTNIWTSKESIYKALGIKGLSFSNNIMIEEVKKNKTFAKGYYINGEDRIQFDLNFFYIDKYILCYAQQNEKL